VQEIDRRRPSFGEVTRLDFSKPGVRWALIALVLGLVVLAVVSSLGRPSGVTVSGGRAKVGANAPDFTTTQPNGKIVRLSDFRGRPVLLNFWATWCTACQDEMPAIQAAVKNHSSDRVQVLAIDYRETDTRAITNYLSGLHVNFIPALDPQGRIAAAYGVSIGLPVSVFVDANGVVRAMHTGQMSPPIIEADIGAAVRR
jgi:peroxiredoxin